jgi:HlyD family secretion protein
MRVTLPRGWIALATLALLVVGAVAWGIFGRLPVTVSARGLLLSPERLAAIPELESAPREGQALVSLSCFHVRDGGRLERGMTVGVSPDALPRERYGDVVASIVALTEAPVSAATVAKALDNAELAAQLVPPEGCILAVAVLTAEASTASGYRWSSSRGPDRALVAGIPTTARVVVERVAPISFVLPIFAAGD